uniref:Uncharacterized protein n=1 Tax=Anguilla anguilla TaxID=7936 RepID=A0A0E9R5Q8_ANGAN
MCLIVRYEQWQKCRDIHFDSVITPSVKSRFSFNASLSRSVSFPRHSLIGGAFYFLCANETLRGELTDC